MFFIPDTKRQTDRTGRPLTHWSMYIPHELGQKWFEININHIYLPVLIEVINLLSYSNVPHSSDSASYSTDPPHSFLHCVSTCSISSPHIPYLMWLFTNVWNLLKNWNKCWYCMWVTGPKPKCFRISSCIEKKVYPTQRYECSSFLNSEDSIFYIVNTSVQALGNNNGYIPYILYYFNQPNCIRNLFVWR